MKALQRSKKKKIMVFCKVLVSLLLLLLAFCCRTTMEQPWTSFPPSPSPSPSPGGQAERLLPQEEVDAVNALYRLLRKSLRHFNVTFSRTSCNPQSQSSDATKCDCSSPVCRVTEIDLSSQNLKGRIPDEIGVLSLMTSLDLSDNRLSGQIPSSFMKLTQLSYLDLSGNRLSGQIPSFFFVSLTQLSYMDLSANNFFGQIPSSSLNLTRLLYLDLSENQLSGPIPSSFVNLTQLSTLYLYDNYLEGNLPLFISEMKSLQNLYLDNNFFNESIPHTLGFLPSLVFLSLTDNLLSGSIPVELGNISSLQQLYLDNNLLKEQLPQHLGNLSNLYEMYLMNNDFSGELPSSFGKLGSMKYFNIQGNSISGTIPDFIANWQGLEQLNLIGNNFGGSLPTNISALRYLTRLMINNLSGSPRGSLFPQLSNATSLQVLTLRNCSLTDRIPDYIWQLSALAYLDLSFNNLTGGILADVKNPVLRNIYLASNKLSGSLPRWMLNSNESFVDVSENIFSDVTISGNIFPNKNLFECCSNISDTLKKWLEVDYQCPNTTSRYNHLYINCGGNQTSINDTQYQADWNPDENSVFNPSSNGAWASSSMGISQYLALEKCNVSSGDDLLYMTARVSTISLKYYGFCLKDDDYIVRLHFAEIGLKKVNVNHSDIKRRRVFDVEIQGIRVLTNFNIEEATGGVNKGITKEFNISVNTSRLEIHLYWSGKGSTSTSPPRQAGPLISAISISPVPKKHTKLSPIIIAAIVGPVLLFVLMILGLCWKLGKLGGERPNGVEVYPGGVFNFQQIKAATNNFAPDKKIGQGGFGAVYRGTLPNGTEIAVKQLSTKSKQGVSEFINEMGTIYALKHPNLVRLMGCCAEENQLLLVYEYMENNSLGHALFGPDQGVKEKLNWKIRVKICLDVANGLAYLHEECKLKLIHGDIKPTNILLDKDFNAKISDFGFARTDEKESTHRNARPDEGETTPINARIKGTLGYIAPECMKAKYSPKVDVYSFGILTLEIISGKQSSTPNSRGQTIYLLDMAYEYLRQGNPLALIDSRLGSEYNVKEAKQIIYLAMQCINHNPDQRPTMSEVVKILEGKKTIDNILVPIAAVDDLMMGKATVAFSQSIHSASTFSEGASDSKATISTSKEIDDSSLSVYDSAQRPAS